MKQQPPPFHKSEKLSFLQWEPTRDQPQQTMPSPLRFRDIFNQQTNWQGVASFVSNERTLIYGRAGTCLCRPSRHYSWKGSSFCWKTMQRWRAMRWATVQYWPTPSKYHTHKIEASTTAECLQDKTNITIQPTSNEKGAFPWYLRAQHSKKAMHRFRKQSNFMN